MFFSGNFMDAKNMFYKLEFTCFLAKTTQRREILNPCIARVSDQLKLKEIPIKKNTESKPNPKQ